MTSVRSPSATAADLAAAIEFSNQTSVSAHKCKIWQCEESGLWRCGCGRAFRRRGWAASHVLSRRRAEVKGETGDFRWLQNVRVFRKEAGVTKKRLTHSAASILKPFRRLRLCREAAIFAARLEGGPVICGEDIAPGEVAVCADMIAAGRARLLPEHWTRPVQMRSRRASRQGRIVRVVTAGEGRLRVVAAAGCAQSWVSCRSFSSRSS